MTSESVLSFFKEITKVPRESGHEEQIIAYLQNFAAERNLECKTDEAGNVLIVKEAAPGFENVPAIVLQSHSDMVCEKNAGVEHDFAKGPIRYVVEDGWMIHPERSDAAKQQAQSKFCRAEWQRNAAEQNLTREIAKRFNEEGISGRFMTRLLALSSI